MDTPHTPLDILLVGAAGLVGQGVLRACLESPAVGRIVSLQRHRHGPGHPRVEVVLLEDFTKADTLQSAFEDLDACFYCAGATPIGTPEEEYRRVTVDLTLAVARSFAAANPQGTFLYVSGAHANPRSGVMPLRVKGEAEQALAALPVRTVSLRPAGVRPVAGTHTRHDALKPLYAVAGPLMRLGAAIAPSLVTDNLSVGKAMIALAAMPDPPASVTCRQIRRLAAG